MATNNRGGAGRGRNTVAKPKSAPIRSTSARTSPNSGSFLSTVRERLFAAAAIVAGAAGAGAFLWAKRAQLTEQVSHLSEAIGERFSGSDAGEASGTDPASRFK
ncbi:MAG: hypothetical protein M3N02_03350, partial [Pseudomonadota bacterium]|nr:hypothetical protein [Pseudomonadota bacterium]